MGGISSVVSMLSGTIIAMLAVIIIASPITDSATDVSSQVISVSPDAGGLGSLILTNQHWYTTTKEMTVTGATDGDVTATSTVAADRKTISMSGLTPTTAQNFTVTQLVESSNDTLNIVLKIFPFLILMAALASAFGAVFVGAKSGSEGGFGGSTISSVITVFIGAVLVPVILSFTAQADATYTIAPEFIGITLMLPLVSIGYIMGLLAAAFGSFAPSVKGAFSS